MHELRDKTINGISWNVVNQLGRQILYLIITIILARLLSPHEFGLVGMISVITGFAIIFVELGFGAALVQKQDVQQEHLSSVFWLNLLGGLLVMIIFMAGASLIAEFFHEPQLRLLTTFICLNFFIGALSMVQRTLLTKTLDFRMLGIVNITSTGAAGITAIAMASAGFGVWSLVAQSLLTSLVEAILLWKLNDWRPAFFFSWASVKEILGFSLSMLGTKSFGYWTRNIDNLLIGRFLGSDQLGVYSRAYAIMLFPLSNVSRVLSGVMFPSFSIIQADKPRVKKLYLRITRSVALVTFPMMLGLFVLVEPFVLTAFGSQWVEMIPILQILSLVGLSQSVETFTGSLYQSQGRADLQFKIGLILKPIVILGIALGLQGGVVGVSIGYAIASFVISYPSLYFAGGLVNLTILEQLRNLSSVFGCAVGMAGLVWGFGLLLSSDWPAWIYLVVQVPFGVAVYLLLLHLFKVRAYQDARALLLEQWHLRKYQLKLVGQEAGS